jgi:hypothetical protein
VSFSKAYPTFIPIPPKTARNLLLPLKYLTDNDVADVATFQTISTCETDLKSLKINIVLGVFDGFLTMPSLPISNFSTVFPAGRANLSRRLAALERGESGSNAEARRRRKQRRTKVAVGRSG